MKRIYIIIAILFLLVCLIIGLLARSGKNNQTTTSLPTPTPIQSSNQTTGNVEATVTNVPIFQDPGIKKELNLLENRQPLTNTDADTKTKLITSLAPDSETIYATADYNIDYIRPIDEFQVEILTTNTQQAKTEAVTWMMTQGMTHDGICKLPLTFYTNSLIYRQLKSQGINDITPLADGC